jgi:2-oxoglutarate dehydrogenase E2 component (dihydrolipoamide succinyltransferase)
MTIEIKVPSFGESINEVTLAKWLKKDGEVVQQDENICELESEKATFELPAEKAGQLKITVPESTVLKIGDVICTIDTDAEVTAAETEAKPTAEKEKSEKEKVEKKEEPVKESPKTEPVPETYAKNVPSPAADKMMRETGLQFPREAVKTGA